MALLLDSISAVPLAAYSLRRLRNAYTGPAVQVIDISTSVTTNIGFTADGDFDITAFLAVGASQYLQIQKLYDQQSNKDLDFGTVRPTVKVLPRPAVNWGTVPNNNIVGLSSNTVNLTAPKQFLVLDYIHQGTSHITDFGSNLFSLSTGAGATYVQANGTVVTYNSSNPSPFVELRGATQVSSYFQTGADAVRVNGIALGGAGDAGDTARNTVPVVLGNTLVGGQGMCGFIYEYLLFDGTVSTGDRDTIEASQINYYARRRRLVAHGDSLSMGYGLVAGIQQTANYAAQARDLLGANWDIYDRGISGQTISDMIGNAATHVDILYQSSALQNILLVQGGFNDAFQGASAATIQSRLQTYLTARQAVGWKIVIAPLPRSNFAGQPADYATTRATVNAWIAANTNFYDAYSDFTNDTRIGTTADTTNTNYFQADQIHLAQGGHAVWSTYTKSAVLAVAQGLLRWTAPINFQGFSTRLSASGIAQIPPNTAGVALKDGQILVARWNLVTHANPGIYVLQVYDLATYTPPSGTSNQFDLVIATRTKGLLQLGETDGRVLTVGYQWPEGSLSAIPAE
jgi:lysophospholipase L1-like esterase